MSAREDGDERIGVSTRVDELRAHGSDEITAYAHAIADNHGTAAQHGLIDNNSKRIVSRRKYQEIRGRIDGRELRLIEETEKPDARSNAKAGCFGLNQGTKRTLAGKDKDGVRKIGF